MPTNQMRVLPVRAWPARKFARVAGEKTSFLVTWKLIFTSLEFYRECQPIKWECTRSQHGSLRVSQGKKMHF